MVHGGPGNKTRLTRFLPPLIQLLIFGYAVNLDLEHTRIAWMDMDRTPESRDLGSPFAASRYFEVVATPENEQQVQQLMDRSRVQAVIRVLPGFARDIKRGETAGQDSAWIAVGMFTQAARRYEAPSLRLGGALGEMARRRLTRGPEIERGKPFPCFRLPDGSEPHHFGAHFVG